MTQTIAGSTSAPHVRCDSHAQHRHSRRSLQVVGRSSKSLWIVSKMTKHVSVARCAKQSSDCPGGMAVIHTESLPRPGSTTAYKAPPVLVLIDLPVLLLGDPVRLPHPLRPRHRRAHPTLGAVVGGTPWTGVRSLALGGDPFIDAVHTRLALGAYVVGREPLTLLGYHFARTPIASSTNNHSPNVAVSSRSRLFTGTTPGAAR